MRLSAGGPLISTMHLSLLQRILTFRRGVFVEIHEAEVGRRRQEISLSIAFGGLQILESGPKLEVSSI